MRLRRWGALLMALTLLCAFGTAAASDESWFPLQDCHRVTLDYTDSTQDNGSVIRRWEAKTAQSAVDAEINGLVEGFAQELGPALPKGANKTSRSSRADIEIRYSRTGMHWLSFLVQARVSYHRKPTGQRIASRTYDMDLGRRILLTDIFAKDSAAWDLLADAVQTTVTAYFPEQEPDAGALAKAVSRDSLEQAEFTLHGMSMTLHYPAETFYPEAHTLIKVTLMYPDIRPYMTDEARFETDNAAYYRFAALTFDDGPTRTNTTLVLQNLMKAGARGTFFVIGNRVKGYQDLVQREHDEGHAIGGHNWHHGNVAKSSGTALRAMPAKVDAALIEAIGIPSRYDRVPHGQYPVMEKAKVGWAYIQWSLDTYDWRGRNTATILKEVQKQASDGDIILMHDIKDKTPETALAVAQWLQENGFMLLTVDELFAKDGIELQPDHTYWHNADGDTSIKKR